MGGVFRQGFSDAVKKGATPFPYTGSNCAGKLPTRLHKNPVGCPAFPPTKGTGPGLASLGTETTGCPIRCRIDDFMPPGKAGLPLPIPPTKVTRRRLVSWRRCQPNPQGKLASGVGTQMVSCSASFARASRKVATVPVWSWWFNKLSHPPLGDRTRQCKDSPAGCTRAGYGGRQGQPDWPT